MKALLAAANLAVVQNDLDRTEVLCEESLARCRELGDTWGISLSLRLLGGIAFRRVDLGVASRLAEEALALCRELGDKDGIAWSLSDLAHIRSQQGKYARAIALHEESLALYQEVGDMEHVAQSHCCLAEMLLLSQGDPTSVQVLLDEGLVRCRALGYKRGIADGLSPGTVSPLSG